MAGEEHTPADSHNAVEEGQTTMVAAGGQIRSLKGTPS